jgi:hypothetical protein
VALPPDRANREAQSLAVLAEIAAASDDHDEASTLISRSLTLAEESHNRACEADVLIAAGRVAHRAGDHPTAPRTP